MSNKNENNEEEMENKKFDKKAFLMKHIKYTGEMISYGVDELLEMIDIAKVALQNDSMLVEINAPFKVVGDLHGQYEELLQIFATEGRPDVTNYLFLGDYVDRGPFQLEVICCLFAWRINYPHQLKLLRGNHETRIVNKNYGFFNDFYARFPPKEAEELYEAFNGLFDWLPVAGLISKKFLCMHGGLGNVLQNLDQIRHIKRPLIEVANNPVAQDLIWADPCVDSHGTVRNHMRGGSYFFGEDKVIEICESLGIEMIVRAHQMMFNGYGFFCGRRLVTVFSAPNYYGSGTNMSAIMTITKTLSYGFTLFNPTTNFDKGEEEFREIYNTAPPNWGYVSRQTIEDGVPADSSMTMRPSC